MKKVISITCLLLSFAVFSQCSKVWVVKNPQAGIKIYFDDYAYAGRNYQTLGEITSRTTKFGIRSFYFINNDTLGVGNRGAYTGNDTINDEVMSYLQENLISKAQAMGANAIINVRYGAREYPFFFPGLGPFSIRVIFARGEAVRG